MGWDGGSNQKLVMAQQSKRGLEKVTQQLTKSKASATGMRRTAL